MLGERTDWFTVHFESGRMRDNRVIRTGLAFSFGLILTVAISGRLGAQEQTAGKALRVATRLVAPFVVQEGGQLRGFSIELWRSIATAMGVKSEFRIYPSVSELLKAIETNQADVAVAAISITAEREMKFEFSHPIFESGLQIMVRDNGGRSGSSGVLTTVMNRLRHGETLQLVGLILVMMLIPAHIIWLLERRHANSIVDKRYFPGICTACWWSASTLATQAEEMPKSPVGRIVAVFWMFCSVVFVAYFTASVTSELTIQQLQGDIRGPRDLPGKRVATVDGSTSATYLREANAQVVPFANIKDAITALLDKKADAVVYDSPILMYYAAQEGEGRVNLVGPVFRKENYGIALPASTTLRKQINTALLEIRENGTYQSIYDEWFTAK